MVIMSNRGSVDTLEWPTVMVVYQAAAGSVLGSTTWEQLETLQGLENKEGGHLVGLRTGEDGATG